MRTQRGRRPDAAEQRAHRAVPQQVHVIDRIRPGSHPGHQARHLQVRVDPALAAGPDMPGDLTRTLGMLVLTRYVLPFELLAVLMLAGMLGAIYFARPED